MQSRFTSDYNKEANIGKGEGSDFISRKTVEFYKMNSISYRAEVVQTTDGRLYVSLARYWLSPQTGNWTPPTKKQVFMPVAAWKNMKQAMSLFDDSLDEIMPRNTANKYSMFIIFPIQYLLLNYNLLAFYIEHIVYKESTLKIYLFTNLIF